MYCKVGNCGRQVILPKMMYTFWSLQSKFCCYGNDNLVTGTMYIGCVSEQKSVAIMSPLSKHLLPL